MKPERSGTPGEVSGVGGGVRHVEVPDGDAGQRLDNFLARHLKGVPRSHVYRLLRKGEVRVNSKRADPSQRLEAGDRVRIPPVRTGELPAASVRPPGESLRRLIESSIIHEDDQLLVVNKPAGIAVHGGSGMAHGVIETLRAMRPEASELDLVHRLDRDTSGCLMIAKRRSALRDLHAQMRDGLAEKRYLALLCGPWNLGEKRIELPLSTHERRGGERHVAVKQHGAMAVSTFRPVQFFGNVATLVEVDLGTGKTHQIRVHAAYAGHPVAGDDKYGDRERNAELVQLGLKRMFLHAASLGITRPGSREPFVVSAPLPDELRSVLDALEKTGRARRGSAAGRSARGRAASVKGSAGRRGGARR